MLKNLALGQISYINCLPLNMQIEAYLKQPSELSKLAASELFKKYNFTDLNIELTSAVPSKLNQLLNAGKVDLGPISSYEYLIHKEKYDLLNTVCISAKKEVDSVFFVTDSLENLEKIYITDQSATSFNLLKVLLKFKYNYDLSKLEFVKVSDYTKAYSNQLIIGDDALKLDQGRYQLVLDLACEWYEFTKGYPMVFGVWAANKSSNLDTDLLSQAFGDMINFSLSAESEKLIYLAKKITNLETEILERYFKKLDYDFNEKKHKSLSLFNSYLEKI
jgi:chorismate dehydratase